jgi:hypothetical protein
MSKLQRRPKAVQVRTSTVKSGEINLTAESGWTIEASGISLLDGEEEA